MEKMLAWIETNYVKAALIAVGVLALLVGLLIGAAAHAGDMNGTVSYPTKNTDGSDIPATGAGSISGLIIEYGTCTGAAGSYAFGTKLGTVNVAPHATTWKVTGLAPGVYCVRAYSVNTYATMSGASGLVNGTVATPVPLPPVLTIATVAYELRQYTGGTLRFVSIGTVPMGVDCPGAKLVGDFRAFDGATITKPTTGGIIAAKCG